jgi:signal transduction histidine kinase
MFAYIRAGFTDAFFRRLVTLAGAIIVLLLAEAYVSGLTYRHLIKDFVWVERTFRVLHELEETERDMAFAESDLRTYLITADVSLKSAFADAVASMQFNEAQAESLIIDPEQKANMSRLQDMLKQRRDLFRQSLEQKGKTGLMSAAVFSLLNQATQLSQQIHGHINVMYDRQYELLEIRKKGADQAYGMVRIVSYTANLLIMLLALSALVLIALEMRRRNKVEQALHEASRNKDRFFSIISHDLRSPFASILGLSDLMADRSLNLDQEKLSQMGQLLNETSKNTYRLLQNLLDWSRLQMERFDMKPERVDLNELIQQEKQFLDPAADRKGISVRFAPSVAVLVYADRDMTATVVRNLLGNALKFTPRGGAVTVVVTPQNGLVQVAVTDTGVGIPDSLRDNLFQIHQHFSSKGTENEKGTGLGLILCREFVEKMGGKIWFSSAVNQGPTFYFTLKKV